MWFRVIFYEHIQPIAAALGDDGNVYFKATDVGRLLGFSNVYSFSHRYGITDFNTKLPPQMKRVDVAKKCMVFDFSEMISIIRQKKHKLQSRLDVDDMIDLWTNGSVDSLVPMRPVLDFRYSPALLVGRNKTLGIQDWIRSYGMVLYDFLQKMKDYCYYEQPPSVMPQDDENMIDDPPFKTMLNHASDNRMMDDPERNRMMDDPERNRMLDDRMMDDPERSNSMDQKPEIEQSQDPEKEEARDNPIHVPENPERLYSLKMNFDAFPPDQIFINIYNKSLKYVYCDSK